MLREPEAKRANRPQSSSRVVAATIYESLPMSRARSRKLARPPAGWAARLDSTTDCIASSAFSQCRRETVLDAAHPRHLAMPLMLPADRRDRRRVRSTASRRNTEAVTCRRREISWATRGDWLGSLARRCRSHDRWQGPTEEGVTTRRGNRVEGSAIPVTGLTRRTCPERVAMRSRWPALTADIASPPRSPDHGVTGYDSACFFS
jgi:hypothetical protein